MTPDELKRLLLGGFTIDDITQYGQTSYGNKMNLSQDDIWNGTGTNLQPIRTKQRTPPGLKEGQYASGTYGRVGNTDDESYDEAKLGKLLDGGGRRIDPRAFSPGVKNTLIEPQQSAPQPSAMPKQPVAANGTSNINPADLKRMLLGAPKQEFNYQIEDGTVVNPNHREFNYQMPDGSNWNPNTKTSTPGNFRPENSSGFRDSGQGLIPINELEDESGFGGRGQGLPPSFDPQEDAANQLNRALGGKSKSSGMERSIAAPMEFRTGNQPNFDIAMQNQNGGANGLKGINDQFDADWQAGAPARQAAQTQQRVDQTERQTQSIEDSLMGKTNMLQGMANRNQRTYNGGGPTPGEVGDNAMAMNQADIRKQLAGMNPMVDQLSPLQMRGDVDRQPEDTRDMSPQGVQDRLKEAFGLRPGDSLSNGGRKVFESSDTLSNGNKNPFAVTTRSHMKEDGGVQLNSKYADEEAMRAANKELMAKRRAAPAQARLNQLQFTQKQLANALSGKPMDDLPKDLSADAANELVRGSARQYRRGENMKTFQDLLAQGLSPDPNPRVREQFAEGALAAKRGQVDADLRAKLAGQQMEQQAIEGDKNRANRLELGKMDADAQMAAANSRGGGDTAEMKFAATKLRIEQELANPKLTPDERRQLENEYRQLLGRQPMAPLPPPAPPKPSIVERIVAGDQAASQPTPDYAVGLAPSTESGRKMGASLMQRIFGPY